MQQLLVSGQPLLIFLEEPPGAQGPRLSALGQTWLGLVVQAVRVGTVPDAMLVPVAITYDLVPDAPRDTYQVRLFCFWEPQVDIISRGGTISCPVAESPLGLELRGECPGVSPLQSLSCGTYQVYDSHPLVSSSKALAREGFLLLQR